MSLENFDAAPRFLRPKDAAAHFGVTVQTLRRWEKQGLITAVRSEHGRVRRYDVASYGGAPTPGRTVLYASDGGGGKGFLQRQIACLLGLYPQAEIITDDAPAPENGAGGRLPGGLARLVQGVAQRKFAKVVVTSMDRLGLMDADCFRAFAHHLGCQIVEVGGGRPPDDVVAGEARAAAARINIRLEQLTGGDAAIRLTLET